MKGVSKQAVAKRVERFAAQGLLETRAGRGGAKLVEAAAYDRVAGEAGDAIRGVVAPRPLMGEAGESPAGSLASHQAKRMAYQAEMARLDLEARVGRILELEAVTNAMTQCAEAMVRVIDQLPSRADELASAVAREGEMGARAFLRTIAREWRNKLAESMRLLEAAGQAQARGDAADDGPDHDA